MKTYGAVHQAMPHEVDDLLSYPGCVHEPSEKLNEWSSLHNIQQDILEIRAQVYVWGEQREKPAETHQRRQLVKLQRTNLLFRMKSGNGLGPAVNASMLGHTIVTLQPLFAIAAHILGTNSQKKTSRSITID